MSRLRGCAQLCAFVREGAKIHVSTHTPSYHTSQTMVLSLKFKCYVIQTDTGIDHIKQVMMWWCVIIGKIVGEVGNTSSPGVHEERSAARPTQSPTSALLAPHNLMQYLGPSMRNLMDDIHAEMRRFYKCAAGRTCMKWITWSPLSQIWIPVSQPTTVLHAHGQWGNASSYLTCFELAPTLSRCNHESQVG
jgi:hypothetical protein